MVVVATTFGDVRRGRKESRAVPCHRAREGREKRTRVGFVDQLTRGFERNEATATGDCERSGGEARSAMASVRTEKAEEKSRPAVRGWSGKMKSLGGICCSEGGFCVYGLLTN